MLTHADRNYIGYGINVMSSERRPRTVVRLDERMAEGGKPGALIERLILGRHRKREASIPPARIGGQLCAQSESSSAWMDDLKAAVNAR